MKEFIAPEGHYRSKKAFSPAIKFDLGETEMIFVAGQLAKDTDGSVVGLGDVARQTECIFEKIKAILAEADATLEDLVKVVIYMTDISKSKEASEVRNRYLATSKPVSTLVEINRTVTDGCDIEIDAIAIKKK